MYAQMLPGIACNIGLGVSRISDNVPADKAGTLFYLAGIHWLWVCHK